MQIRKPFNWLQPHLGEFVSNNGTQLVCEFVDVAHSSVERWASDKVPAQGKNEIRLWHFMLAAGYEFSELRIPEYNYYIAQLYAYSIITLDEVMQLCGVKNSQDALQILRGRQPMRVAMTLDELKLMYDEDLKAKIEQLRKQLEVAVKSTEDQLPTPSQEVEALAPALDALMSALANQLKAVAPMAKLALDMLSPEQRSHLRELVSIDLMFDLSNDMNALCSERARSSQGRR